MLNQIFFKNISSQSYQKTKRNIKKALLFIQSNLILGISNKKENKLNQLSKLQPIEQPFKDLELQHIKSRKEELGILVVISTNNLYQDLHILDNF